MEKLKFKYQLCFSTFLYNTLQNYQDKTIIIETRDEKCSRRACIQGSILLNNEQIINNFSDNMFQSGSLEMVQGFLEEKDAQKFSKIKRCFCILISNENFFNLEGVLKITEEQKISYQEKDFFELEEGIIENYITNTENSNENSSLNLSLRLSKIFLREKIRETYILIEGAASLFQRYPFLDIKHSSEGNILLLYI